MSAMRTTERLVRRAAGVAAAVAAAVAGMISPAAMAQTHYGFGQPATAAEISSWDIDVAPDGRNLPRGQGTFARGRDLYASRCAACHGPKGEGGLGDKLAGGAGSLATATPVKTIGSYWPYATTLFDYIRRAMPLDSPQSLSNDDVYAVSGYLLYLNGLVPEGTTVDAQVLMSVKMPNRDGFVDDPRPDVK
jgi:S-disulfanyl-L-cysteine oxidoreductase SoxD